MPLMRLDESGNPVYYLTDAMGSVIGLADGSGVEVADFRYDSFGNLRSSTGVEGDREELAGGDFRFQGQWLESNTDLYHFRARYYDPESGRFVSRDPVELIEFEPESSNPYQFVYNNPHIYSDPTGEVVFAGQAAASKIQTILRKIHQKATSQITRTAIDEAKGVVSEVAQNYLGKLLPTDFARISNVVSVGGNAGTLVENFLIDNSLRPVLEQMGLSRFVWREVDIRKSDGKPLSDGYRIDGNPRDRRRPSASPGRVADVDILISSIPAQSITPLKKAWILGDVKTSAKDPALEVKNDARNSQWEAIRNFATKNQYVPTAFYAALFTTDRATIRQAEAKALKERNVILRIISLTNIKR